MTITLDHTDIAAYRTRIERHNTALRCWLYEHAGEITILASKSETDTDFRHKLNKYIEEHNFPRLELFNP